MLEAGYNIWFHGYVTGFNVHGPDPTGDLLGPGNDDLIDKWIDRWCGGRPAALLMQAMAPLVGHFAAERAAGRLPPGRTPAIEPLIPTTAGRR